jgi:hypothetical protein
VDFGAYDQFPFANSMANGVMVVDDETQGNPIKSTLSDLGFPISVRIGSFGERSDQMCQAL